MKRKKERMGKSLIQELLQIFNYLSLRRRYQVTFLLILMVFSSFSEIVNLGCILPFLAALSNPSVLLVNPRLKTILTLLNISTPAQLVMSLSITLIVVIVITALLRILTIYWQTHLAASIASDISCQLYNQTLLQTYDFYLFHNSSDLINCVINDTRQLTIKILIPLMSAISNCLVILALVTGLFLIEPRIAIFSLIILGGIFFALYRLRRKQLGQNSKILVQTNQELIKIVQESLGGIRDVLLGETQELFQLAYRNADLPYRQAVASNTVMALTPRYIVEGSAMILMVILALSLGQNGDFSQVLPILGSLALGATRLLPALQRSFSALVHLQGARSSLKRILIGLQREINPLQAWVPEKGLELEKNLQFDNVWFRYNNDNDWILKNFNLTIKAKTTVGFVGSTGSGKSTTADLILGLLQPQKGKILVDGLPLEGKRLRQWQKNIAHVPQSIFLIDATIYENIAFGVPYEKIDFGQVRKAAVLAQIEDFIQQLPAKYDTYVGERGVRLSGGQRQRIGIARALYRNASVILFDEATSALDSNTELEVMKAIEGLSHQFTIILIAHRLSSLKCSDLIVELDQGQVVPKL